MTIENTTMTAEEFRNALERLEMTQSVAGELFGVGPRSSRRWALNEARVPVAVAMLLKLMLKKRLKLEVPGPFNEAYRVWQFSAESAKRKLE